jgi:hypothetical protein
MSKIFVCNLNTPASMRSVIRNPITQKIRHIVYFTYAGAALIIEGLPINERKSERITEWSLWFLLLYGAWHAEDVLKSDRRWTAKYSWRSRSGPDMFWTIRFIKYLNRCGFCFVKKQNICLCFYSVQRPPPTPHFHLDFRKPTVGQYHVASAAR